MSVPRNVLTGIPSNSAHSESTLQQGFRDPHPSFLIGRKLRSGRVSRRSQEELGESLKLSLFVIAYKLLGNNGRF